MGFMEARRRKVPREFPWVNRERRSGGEVFFRDPTPRIPSVVPPLPFVSQKKVNPTTTGT